MTMKPSKRKGLALVLSFTTVALLTGAQSTEPASKPVPGKPQPAYVNAAHDALVSGTEATNFADVELSSLMNESIKTNLAAQLWFRQALGGRISNQGAKIAIELRLLETLRAGRTDDAIRQLEESLDGDIIAQAADLRRADKIKGYAPTPQGRKALRWAKDYRLKFPHKGEDPASDKRVADALSYTDE